MPYLLWKVASFARKQWCCLFNSWFYRTMALLCWKTCWTSLKGGTAWSGSRTTEWRPCLRRPARTRSCRRSRGWATRAPALRSFGCSSTDRDWWTAKLALKLSFLYLDGKSSQTAIRCRCLKRMSGILVKWRSPCCWLSTGTSKSWLCHALGNCTIPVSGWGCPRPCLSSSHAFLCFQARAHSFLALRIW